MHKKYEINSDLTPEAAIGRLGALLSYEGVDYSSDSFLIVSTRTPVAILSIQSALYSRKNWVGLNPFAFITGVEVRCQVDNDGRTRATLRVNQSRAYLFFAFWTACGFLAASSLPQPFSAMTFVAVALVGWFGHVSFLGGYLVVKEVADELK